MPKILSDSLTDSICRILSVEATGMSIDQVHGHLSLHASRRTLQRRLAALLSQGRIKTVGNGRGLRYVASDQPQRFRDRIFKRQSFADMSGSAEDWQSRLLSARMDLAEPDAHYEVGSRLQMPELSDAGLEIRSYVRRHLSQRRPVGYEYALLEQYAPNRTFYLPESLRKQLHLMGRPADTEKMSAARAGTLARDLLNRLLIDLSWASSHLEGNTYSKLDTERLIRLGEVAEGKDAIETRMILNHKTAIEYLVFGGHEEGVSSDNLIALHALLSDDLMPDPMMCGRLRTAIVEISGSVYLPLGQPQRIEELFRVVHEMASEIADPFEQSFFLMVHIPYLQPFEDVNKRVSRLAANIPLIQSNLSPLSFVGVAAVDYIEGLLGVYELNRIDLLRDVFVHAYERSCQQYVAVQRQLVPPNALRLKYRHALTNLVAQVIRDGIRPERAIISNLMPSEILDDDRPAFINLVLKELNGLHAGNVIRFGIRPLEWQAWQSAHAGSHSGESNA